MLITVFDLVSLIAVSQQEPAFICPEQPELFELCLPRYNSAVLAQAQGVRQNTSSESPPSLFTLSMLAV